MWQSTSAPEFRRPPDQRSKPFFYFKKKDAMSEPIVFVIRFKIKEGKADKFRKHYQDSIQPTFDAKPDTLAQLAYENEEATVFTVIRFFPSADALDHHLEGADERSKKTFTFIEPYCIKIFGTPNLATLEKMEKIAGSGVTMSISSNYMGGFIRYVESEKRRK
jgi:quinol monooxygenase YgiN